MHLQQYEENHCAYLGRIGCHSEKKPTEHDHACAAQNYVDVHNLHQ